MEDFSNVLEEHPCRNGVSPIPFEIRVEFLMV